MPWQMNCIVAPTSALPISTWPVYTTTLRRLSCRSLNHLDFVRGVKRRISSRTGIFHVAENYRSIPTAARLVKRTFTASTAWRKRFDSYVAALSINCPELIMRWLPRDRAYPQAPPSSGGRLRKFKSARQFYVIGQFAQNRTRRLPATGSIPPGSGS